MARRPVTSVTFTGVLLALLLAMLGTVPAAAEQTHIRAALVAESADPASGRDVVVALVMRPDPGWHGYWLNPGDAGLAPIVEWQLPQGVKAGPLTFPVPRTLLVAGLMNHVYEGEYAHLVTLKLPAGLAPGTPLPLRAAARWLACTDTICVPERAALALDLVVGKGLADPARRGDFDRWRAALPKPLDAPASYSVSAGKFRPRGAAAGHRRGA